MTTKERKKGETIDATIDLPLINDDGGLILKPKAILDTQQVKKGARFIEKSLVKWKRLTTDDATWENTKELQDRFMNLDLGDKVPMKE